VSFPTGERCDEQDEDEVLHSVAIVRHERYKELPALVGSPLNPEMRNISGVVKLLRKEHDHLTKQIKGIAAALEAFGAAYGKQNGTRKISAAGRARIAAAPEGTMGQSSKQSWRTNHGSQEADYVCDC
jgi:hypothetical protein